MEASENSILLVEDNADDEVLTIRALRRYGILSEIVVVRDGVYALDYLFCNGEYIDREPGKMPVLVLLDLKLPRMDGLEVLRVMRSERRTKPIPVIVLTSSDADSDLVSSYTLGCNAYVRKPIDSVQFTEALRGLGLLHLIEAPMSAGAGRGGRGLDPLPELPDRKIEAGARRPGVYRFRFEGRRDPL